MQFAFYFKVLAGCKVQSANNTRTPGVHDASTKSASAYLLACWTAGCWPLGAGQLGYGAGQLVGDSESASRRRRAGGRAPMAGARRWALDLGGDSDSGTRLRRTATRRAGEGPTAEARGARATGRKTGGSAPVRHGGPPAAADCGAPCAGVAAPNPSGAKLRWRGAVLLSTCRRLVGLGA
jgi:hypothetical protein